jgi:periplasmic divalent cation tolerance protein
MAETKFRIVLVTCGKLSEARKLARTVVDQRLAACVNVSTSAVESVYRWKGKVEVAREYLLIIKTVEKKLAELEKLVAGLHSYDTPEFLVLPVVSGSRKYLDWLAESVAPAQRKR